MLNPGQLAELAREVSRLQAHYAKRLRVHFHDCHAALLVPPEAQQEYKGCGAGTGTAGIRVNGAVTPCVFMPNEVGNLCESSFAEI